MRLQIVIDLLHTRRIIAPKGCRVSVTFTLMIAPFCGVTQQTRGEISIAHSEENPRELPNIVSLTMEKDMSEDYSFHIAVGAFIVADELRLSEKDSERKKKKRRVVDKKFELLKESFPSQTAKVSRITDVRRLLHGSWEANTATTFLIDLCFISPFAPYELRFKEEDLKKALYRVAVLVGRTQETIDRIFATRKDAWRAHRHIQWKKIGLISIASLIIVAAGGWVLAPHIGYAIGAAAGLSGAAATAHGLAILGGGSLALGGFGMAGGMWIVTGAAGAIGLLGAGGGHLLFQLGAATAKVELIKLQVNYRENILGVQADLRKAQEVIVKLKQQQASLEKQMEEEQKLNDKNSQRIKDMEGVLRAIEDSIRWMEESPKEAA